MTRIVLASGSVIRKQLLENAGIAVEVAPHGVDERALMNGVGEIGGRAAARLLAEAKAVSASRADPDAFVIGADQTLEFQGAVFAKPANRTEARDQLRQLSGKTHRLHSAYAVARGGSILSRQLRSARLTMRDLNDGEIGWYLDATGPLAMASVGAYQLEGLGVRLFSQIAGDYFTILGLPMIPLLQSLRRLGAVVP